MTALYFLAIKLRRHLVVEIRLLHGLILENNARYWLWNSGRVAECCPICHPPPSSLPIPKLERARDKSWKEEEEEEEERERHLANFQRRRELPDLTWKCLIERRIAPASFISKANIWQPWVFFLSNVFSGAAAHGGWKRSLQIAGDTGELAGAKKTTKKLVSTLLGVSPQLGISFAEQFGL